MSFVFSNVLTRDVKVVWVSVVNFFPIFSLDFEPFSDQFLIRNLGNSIRAPLVF